MLLDLANAAVLLGNYVVVPGLAYAAQLALGALGITLVFGILRFANLAHGDLMAFGAMATILATWQLQAWGIGIDPLPTALLALPFGMAAAIAAALAADRLVFRFYRRKRSAPVVLVMASLGVMFVAERRGALHHRPRTTGNFTDGERFIVKAREFKQATGLAEGLSIKTTQCLTVVVAVIVVLRALPVPAAHPDREIHARLFGQ